jgi:hypothetical protein
VAREARTKPVRYLAADLLRRMQQGETVFLEARAIGRANTQNGLNLFILHEACKQNLPQLEIVRILGCLTRAFFDLHEGFRLNEIMAQAFGQAELLVLMARGLAPLDQLALAGGTSLMALTKSDALGLTPKWMSSLFAYPPARFFFQEGQQTLLHAALRGETDEELQCTLCISLSAVKKRWRSIVQRVNEAEPGFFGLDEADQSTETRGRGKRVYLLRYLRAHPEELRPLERRTNRAGPIRTF